MKRFTVASLATVTALSLIAMPAQAAEDKGSSTKSSSEITQAEVDEHHRKALEKEEAKKGTGFSQPYVNSSNSGQIKNDVSSSIKNDTARDWKIGTTHDLIWGTGIVALLLALIGGGAFAAQQGLIPGVQF